jgi:ribose 5-phosphate isomerase B
MGKIVIGNDHGAVELKFRIIEYLKRQGFEIANMGIDSENSVDYPDIAEKTCKEYLRGGYDFGIVSCGTGIGISISANKIKGIRCAVVHDLYTAEMAKAHNNANFLAFGGRVQYSCTVEEMIDKFIATKFIGEERHARRVDKIMKIEEPSS